MTVLRDTLTIRDDGGGLLVVRASVERRPLTSCDEITLDVVDGDAHGRRTVAQVSLRAEDAAALAEWIRKACGVMTRATPRAALSLAALRKLLDRAEKDSARCAAARAALPAGSSRARVTSANARWMRAAEQRDRLAAQVAELSNPETR